MVKPKGGRGKKAPYETQQMRVPLPIKEKVERLIEDFRNQILDPASTTNTAEIQEPSKIIEDLKLKVENLNTALQVANQHIESLEEELEEESEKATKVNTGLDNEELKQLISKWKERSDKQSPTNQRWQWGREILKELEKLVGEEQKAISNMPDGQLSLLDQ